MNSSRLILACILVLLSACTQNQVARRTIFDGGPAASGNGAKVKDIRVEILVDAVAETYTVIIHNDGYFPVRVYDQISRNRQDRRTEPPACIRQRAISTGVILGVDEDPPDGWVDPKSHSAFSGIPLPVPMTLLKPGSTLRGKFSLGLPRFDSGPDAQDAAMPKEFQLWVRVYYEDANLTRYRDVKTEWMAVVRAAGL